MAKSVLSRYLDSDVLTQVADRHFDPKQLVIGNLAGHKNTHFARLDYGPRI